MITKNNFILLIGLLFITGFCDIGCSLILGGNQQVDYRSHDYSILRLDHDKANGWKLLTTSKEEEQNEADSAFEHQPTGSIISINSVCHEYTQISLENLSQQLLMGVIKHGNVKTRNLQVDGVTALESTVETSLDEDTAIIQIRAIVLRKSNCIYDFMYIAKPEIFNERLADFESFVKGFHAE